MIYITEFGNKIENILNGIDISETRPTDLLFKVATSGFHIDHIKDKNSKKNFIPVFVNSLGGEFNPIPKLNNTTQTFSITIYFPVEKKEEMFAMVGYIGSQLIGKMIDYGELSGKGLTNISVPEYGEIQNLDFVQFKKWAKDIYAEECIEEKPYMSMVFRVYVSTIGSSFMWSNNVQYGLRFYLDEYRKTIVVNRLKIEEEFLTETVELYRDTTLDVSGVSILGEAGTFDLYAWKGTRSNNTEVVSFTKSQLPDNGDTLYRYSTLQSIYIDSNDVVSGKAFATDKKYYREETLDIENYDAWYSLDSYPLNSTLYLPSGTTPTTNTKMYDYEDGELVESHITVATYQMYDNITVMYEDEELVWSTTNNSAAISPIAQQLVNDSSKYAKNINNITSYGISLRIYMRNTTALKKLHSLYHANKLAEIKNLTLIKTYTFGDNTTLSSWAEDIILSFNENVELGSPITFVIATGSR